MRKRVASERKLKKYCVASQIQPPDGRGTAKMRQTEPLKLPEDGLLPIKLLLIYAEDTVIAG